jgi:hypothetical protein
VQLGTTARSVCWAPGEEGAGLTDLHAARPTRGAHHCREVPRKDDTTATFSLPRYGWKERNGPKCFSVSWTEFSILVRVWASRCESRRPRQAQPARPAGPGRPGPVPMPPRCPKPNVRLDLQLPLLLLLAAAPLSSPQDRDGCLAPPAQPEFLAWPGTAEQLFTRHRPTVLGPPAAGAVATPTTAAWGRQLVHSVQRVWSWGAVARQLGTVAVQTPLSSDSSTSSTGDVTATVASVATFPFHVPNSVLEGVDPQLDRAFQRRPSLRMDGAELVRRVRGGGGGGGEGIGGGSPPPQAAIKDGRGAFGAQKPSAAGCYYFSALMLVMDRGQPVGGPRVPALGMALLREAPAVRVLATAAAAQGRPQLQANLWVSGGSASASSE